MSAYVEEELTSLKLSKIAEAEARFNSESGQARSSYESSLITAIPRGGSAGVYKYIRSLKESREIPETIIPWF